MPLNYPPKPGMIVMCRFDGMREPEMIKTRPAIVLHAKQTGVTDNGKVLGLATVVALSSTPPDPVGAIHHCLPQKCLPRTRFFMGKENWVKGDMIYALSIECMELVQLHRDKYGKRVYFNERLGRERMREVLGCVLSGLNLGILTEYL